MPPRFLHYNLTEKSNCKFKSTLGNCTSRRRWRSSVYNESTYTVQKKRGERHKKASDLLLNTRSSNSGLIENAKPLVHERVGGWVPLQIHDGRELLSLLPLPSQLGILLIAPLPSPAAPAPSFPLFFLPFTGSSFWDSPIVVTEGAD